MSLIVGHAAPDIGFLAADTLLSFPNGLNLEVSRGSNSKGRFGETPKPAREARALPRANRLSALSAVRNQSLPKRSSSTPRRTSSTRMGAAKKL